VKDRNLHVRLENELLEQVKRYAERHHKTVTQLVVEHFRYLISVDEVKTGMVTALEETKRMGHGARASRRHG
jgi:hypothetical protein